MTNLQIDFLADVFGTFHERYPLVDLSLGVSPTGSSGLVEDIRHARLDVAFIGLPPAELPGLRTVPLAHVDYVVVTRESDPLAARKTITLADIAARRQIDTPRGFGNRVILDRAFADAGLTRTVSTELSDLTSIPRFVAAGLGVAIIPAAAPITVPGVAVRPLAGPSLTWTMTAISSASTPPSPAVEALLELLATDERDATTTIRAHS